MLGEVGQGMAIDFEKLWKLVINAPNNRSGHTIHGPDHWLRVERNACILANRTCSSTHALGTQTGHHDDATIGTCWDADRLDIERAGVIPNAKFMSTDFGREIGNHGSVKPWLDLAKPHIADPENYHVRTGEFTDW